MIDQNKVELFESHCFKNGKGFVIVQGLFSVMLGVVAGGVAGAVSGLFWSSGQV